MTTVVLGLDGAAFDLIQPWIASEKLPTFQRLLDEGVGTEMRSCPPPVTCPNWQCYATGKNPGKLGVFWWERVDSSTRSINSTSASHQFDGRYYWRYVDEDCAAVNLPTSYPPPEETNGVHIAGGPGAEQSGYTTPATVEDQLESRYDYAVHPSQLGDLSADNPESPCIDEIYDLIDARFDVLYDYVTSGKFEIVHLTVFYLNVLQHFYWDHDVVLEAWERIDQRVAELLDAPELDTLLVMSDHGSNEIDVSFHINTWLEQEGYLVTSRGINDLLFRLGLTRDRIRPVIASLGFEWWLRKFIPREVQTLLPDSEGRVKEGAKSGIVDWDESVALASGQGPLYVLADNKERRREVRDELVSQLDGLEHDGRPIIDAAIPTAELYDGPYLDRAPDIFLRQASGVHIEGAVGSSGDPFQTPTRWRGENKEEGLFIAHGSQIDPEAAVEKMHILDIAPTVLHRHDTAIPSDMDGQPRTEFFASDSEVARREPRYQDPPNRGRTDGKLESAVGDRLSDLGYLE